MIGVILAGGTGSRMMPITNIVNKSILPVGKHPVIAYILWTLMGSGIKKIVVVLDKNSGAQTKMVINSLGLKGVNISFVYQEKAIGIPSAIGEAEKYVKDESIMVMMGDTIHAGIYDKNIKRFTKGMLAFLRGVDDPTRFAVPIYNNEKELVEIVEKPTEYKSKRAICGPLFFDKSVFSKIKQLDFSARNETELVDLYKAYMNEGSFKLEKADDFTADVGTFESLARTSYKIIEDTVAFKHDYL